MTGRHGIQLHESCFAVGCASSRVINITFPRVEQSMWLTFPDMVPYMRLVPGGIVNSSKSDRLKVDWSGGPLSSSGLRTIQPILKNSRPMTKSP